MRLRPDRPLLPDEAAALRTRAEAAEKREDELLARLAVVTEALTWAIEEDDPAPCPYCEPADPCPAHAALAATPEALTTWLAERDAKVKELEARLPVCRFCGKPAECFGSYERNDNWDFSCGECCGHGNEDGRCFDFVEDWGEIGKTLNAAVEESDAAFDDANAERARIREGLEKERIGIEHPDAWTYDYRRGYNDAIADALAIVEKPEGPR